MYCRRVTVPWNGSVTTNSTEIGVVVEFICDPGFSLVGSHNLTCESSGQWSHTEPECQLSTEGEQATQTGLRGGLCAVSARIVDYNP